MIEYELIVCWSDGTHTDCYFLKSEKELTREEAEQQFISNMAEDDDFDPNNQPGIKYVGILSETEI
jgi:hypothetical protein